MWHQLWSSSAGLDDDVGDSAPAGERPADGDDRRSRARGPRRLERRVRRPRPALVRDADDEPARRRVERQLERLDARDPCSAADRPRQPPRAGSRPRPSAACSEVPQPVTTTASPAARARPDGVGKAAAPPAGPDPRPTIRRRQRGLGRDHVGHVVRRAGSRARHAGRCPRLGRARGARSGRNGSVVIGSSISARG